MHFMLSICIIDFYGKERDTYISTCKWSKYSNSQATSPVRNKRKIENSPVSLSPGTPRLSLLSLMKASAVDVKV